MKENEKLVTYVITWMITFFLASLHMIETNPRPSDDEAYMLVFGSVVGSVFIAFYFILFVDNVKKAIAERAIAEGEDVIKIKFEVPTRNPNAYQKEVIELIESKLTEVSINVGRGDRLLVNGEVLKGILFDERMRMNKSVEEDADVYVDFIKAQLKL
jgi:hypothetical protein